MWRLSLECGIATTSWNAEFALRRRVSMSAIGSVIVIRFFFLAAVPRHCRGLRRRRGYQEDFVTPGSSPAWAISRRQIRHSPNLRYTECGRPQRWQRVYPRTANFGLAAALLTSAFFAIAQLLPVLSLKGKPSALSSARPSSSVLAVVTTVM